VTSWKLPPPAKIYEALSAVADGRVRLLDAGRAEVESSDRTRTYTVEWTPDVAAVSANDNASYWQGYLGYPIIAVLLVLGKVSYESASAEALAGIDWHALNKRFRNDYEAAVDDALASLEAAGTPRQPLVDDVRRIMGQLEGLRLERAGRGRRPPRSRDRGRGD
jgi:hypothetical protein